jgi:2-keto-3-deoxy-L-rhamnonate aldolase RhmA
MSNSPIIHINRVRTLIKDENKTAIGTFLAEIRQPSIAQLLAYGGFDFMMIDNEHGQFPADKIAGICTVARYANITPVVRVPDYSYAQIAQSLDAGAQCLIFPRITDADQVRTIVDIARYPPLGNRGNATNRSYCDFRMGDVMLAMETHNAQTLLIFQIETKEALENLDEILQVKGCDGVLIGPNDLSISLGVPGQINHPTMKKAFETVLSKCQQYGVIPGAHINDPELAGHYAAMGYKFVSSSSETLMIQNGATKVVETVRKALDAKQ